MATYLRQPLWSRIQSDKVSSYWASFTRISGFLFPSPSSAAISAATSAILGSPACLLNASNRSSSEFSSISTPRLYSCLIGALHARKFNYDLKETFMGFHCGNTNSGKLAFFEMKYQFIMARSLPEEVTQGTLEGDIMPGDITFYRLQSC